MGSAEQRASVRFATSIPVRISTEWLDFQDDAEFLGELADFGEGGIFVRCDFLEPPGTQVCVRIEVGPPGAEPLALQGRVAWIVKWPPRGPGMGIELELDAQGKDLFRRLSGRS